MPRPTPETAFREIPLELIDEPPLPMRQTFDPAALDELTESIRRVGVVLPIAVTEHGRRFQIQDGHRRYIGATRAGLKTIPAVIRGTGQISTEAVKCNANLYREDVNPAEQALYFHQLLEQQCGGDVDRLCQLTSLKRAFVEERLTLLAGDPDVFRALQERRISMAVARELNRVKDRGYRMMYLDAAIRGGATARMVQEWRVTADAIAPVEPPPLTPGDNQFTTLPPPITTMTCVCCESPDEPWEMELVPMHKRCRLIFLERFLQRVRLALSEAVQIQGGQGRPHA